MRVLLFALLAWAVSAGADGTYTVYLADAPPTIDGRLDEAAWTAAPDVGDEGQQDLLRRQTSEPEAPAGEEVAGGRRKEEGRRRKEETSDI